MSSFYKDGNIRQSCKQVSYQGRYVIITFLTFQLENLQSELSGEYKSKLQEELEKAQQIHTQQLDEVNREAQQLKDALQTLENKVPLFFYITDLLQNTVYRKTHFSHFQGEIYETCLLDENV